MVILVMVTTAIAQRAQSAEDWSEENDYPVVLRDRAEPNHRSVPGRVVVKLAREWAWCLTEGSPNAAHVACFTLNSPAAFCFGSSSFVGFVVSVHPTH